MEKKRIRLSRILRLAARRYISQQPYDGKFTLLSTAILWASHDCGVMNSPAVFESLERYGIDTGMTTQYYPDLYSLVRRLAYLAQRLDWRVTVPVIR